ncbi:MAG: type II CRISPR-associated endonuclease Cas1 [Planctomycetales bacterium]|nr:type II CRISPR-associated endonuclease Cas1 [Planctomycetales bacterium]
MIKRTIEISRDAAHLAVRNRQLLVQRDGKTIGSIPCEDVGVVLVDHPAATYSHAALAALADSDAALVVCGRNHLPTAMLLPLADHSQVVWRINDQLNASKPLQKQLWRQLIQAKIRAQAANLPPHSRARSKLLDMARGVRSGDPNNVEAHAARVYWQHFLPDHRFRRDADGDGLNSLLNYGYAVVRAAVARAIVAAGLMPAIGLKHSNRSNAFCLADDLIEPLRPLVDDRARDLREQGYDRLTSEAKTGLLSLLADPVWITGERSPLMVSLHRYCASLVKCFRGEAKSLEIPTSRDPKGNREIEIAEASDADGQISPTTRSRHSQELETP